MRFLIPTIVALGVAFTALPAADAQRRGRGDAPIDKREKVKQKIRALRAYTLTEQLALDERTAAKLFPVLAKWDEVTDRLITERVELTRQLQVANGKDAKVIDKLIDDSVANQKALWDLEDRRLAELRKILTPAQVAKLIVVLPEFERRIRNQLRRAMRNREGNPRDGRFRGRRGGAIDPLDGDDDEDEAPTPRSRLPERMRDTPRAPERGSRAPCDPFSTARGCP